MTNTGPIQDLTETEIVAALTGMTPPHPALCAPGEWDEVESPRRIARARYAPVAKPDLDDYMGFDRG